MKLKTTITRYDGFYQCPRSKCKFTCLNNEILVIADYWALASDEADKQPLGGFGRNVYGKHSNKCRQAIFEAVTQEYGENISKTGVVLLSIPTLVMKFVL
jgi:hypothetical protein